MSKLIKMNLQLFASETTKLENLINPEVMADMISAKVAKKIVVAPFAKVDTTLVGAPGDTVTVPQYAYIGDAKDVAEGVEAETSILTATTTKATVKKAVKAVDITDEAGLSGYGDPVGQATNQLSISISSKMDNDAMDVLKQAQLIYDGTAAIISYNAIVDAIDKFNEEVNTEKAMFVNPKQVTQLRKDANFISADKYPGNTVMTGEVGMIANTRIVPSKKVELNPVVAAHYEFCEVGDAGAKEIIADSGTIAGEQVKLATVIATLAAAEVGDIVKSVAEVAAGVYYPCPIIKLSNDAETEDDAAAITIYMKKDTTVEPERKALSGKTIIVANKHYTVALSNTSKVVLAKIKK